MTEEQFKRVLAEDAPLTIRLFSGRSYHVEHTDFAMMNPTARSIVFVEKGSGHVSHILLDGIEAIDMHKAPSQ